MSEDGEVVLVPAGDDDHLEAAWRLKERIRRADGALKQPREHFERAYRGQRAYLLVSDGSLLAFGVIHADGYLSLFGVSPDRRREGLGARLLDAIVDDYSTITCHTRAGNRPAVAFYEDRGFDVVRRIDGYYPDGTDGLFLRSG